MFASAGSSVECERGFAADVVLHLVYLAGLQHTTLQHPALCCPASSPSLFLQEALLRLSARSPWLLCSSLCIFLHQVLSLITPHSRPALHVFAGSSVESERGFAADVVLHLVYLAGLFTFAVVLGIVTDDISTQVDKVRVQR
jgi:hypothetical protein